MQNILFHNPNCSKSRATLEMVKEKGLEVEVREYLNIPPSKAELEFICNYLKITPIKIIRTGEKIFSELGLKEEDNLSVDQWAEILNKNPVLLERPILIYNQKAAIGRPPENILNII